MKLSTKLIGSFVIVVLFIGGIGLVSSYLNDIVKDQATAESNKAIQEITVAGELELQLFRSLTRTQYLLEDSYRETLSMNYDRSSTEKEVQIAEINKALEGFEDGLDELRGLIKTSPPDIFANSLDTNGIINLIDKIEQRYQNYAALLSQFQVMGSENYEDRKEFFTVTIEPYFRTNLLPLIERFRNHIQDSHQQKITQLSVHLDRINNILIGGTVVALLIAIVLVFYIYRSIANPISKIAAAAESFGKGNMDSRIDYDSNDELGQLSNTFDRMAENLSKTTVSRDYVDSIVEAMADLLIVTDEDFRILRANSSVLQMLNCDESELLGKSIQSIFQEIPGEICNEHTDVHGKTYAGEIATNGEQVIPVSISRGTIEDKSGNIEGHVFVASDITAQKKAQQKISESLREKEVLLAEIHHRVKNNLAVISGLLQMQMWESEDNSAQRALQESHLRVQSIALVHEKLYQSESLSYVEFDRYVSDLLDAIGEVYSTDYADIEIQSQIKGITLNINQAIPSALLINELVINAFKYAFDEGEDGIIKVLVEQEDSDIMIQVSDNGKGFGDKEKDIESLGLDLVKTLVAQLDGDLNYSSNNGAHIEAFFTAEQQRGV
ncbi:sensor histidine kinase [Fodinibius sp. Rm-B-1B1-1]|uniref:sensor histidine kinase n=1 Tax=Fodinibius alkaliphilus TaxID=3140241 RepID=UPI00315AD2B8